MWIPLSRQNYLQAWKQAGYRIEMVYLRLRSAQLALRRIAARVREGGHDVPRADVVRSATTVGEKSVKAKTRTRTKASRPLSFAAGVGRALRRAAKDARKTARMYGTPLYVWENGKVVAKKP
jgi:hypothetical protein